jgi:hypothetical protein
MNFSEMYSDWLSLQLYIDKGFADQEYIAAWNYWLGVLETLRIVSPKGPEAAEWLTENKFELNEIWKEAGHKKKFI